MLKYCSSDCPIICHCCAILEVCIIYLAGLEGNADSSIPRWFYWIFTITLAVGTVLVIVLSPETKFIRSPTAMNGEVVFTDEFGTAIFSRTKKLESDLAMSKSMSLLSRRSPLSGHCYLKTSLNPAVFGFGWVFTAKSWNVAAPLVWSLPR